MLHIKSTFNCKWWWTLVEDVGKMGKKKLLLLLEFQDQGENVEIKILSL